MTIGTDGYILEAERVQLIAEYCHRCHGIHHMKKVFHPSGVIATTMISKESFYKILQECSLAKHN